MGKFLIRDVDFKNIKDELISIGFDSSYLNHAELKFCYKNIKIYDLTPAQANILKQTALIFGADCAVNRNVITGNVDYSDVILCGSYSQLQKIAKKLQSQPFKLAILGQEIIESLKTKPRKTKIVGILNITPDSFSDGGLYLKPEDAQKKLEKLISDGADMIDIGAESTRPNFTPVTATEQIERLKPIVDFIQKEKLGIPLSVDTRSSEVADFVLNNGVEIINDVSGFEFDKNMPNIIAKYGAQAIIQDSGRSYPYENIMDEVFKNLKNKIQMAESAGISNVIIDPGICFGKREKENFQILQNISALNSLNCPVMVGISRKSFLGVQNESNDVKDALTLAYSHPLILQSVDFLRVHNVKLHKLLLKSIDI